jgi:hypothetical protein
LDRRTKDLAVRAILSGLLIGFLTLCPILCGAKEFAHGAHPHGTSDAASPDSAPDQCPEDGDNCICQGAVQVDSLRGQDSDVFDLPLLFLAFDPTPPHYASHLTTQGSPTGPSGWGDANTVRSFLQNFRC